MSEAAQPDFDVIVVGAGPAGIAAAVTAVEAGRSVALVDDAPLSGGQIWRHHAEPPAAARNWIDRLRGVERFHQSRVVARPTPTSLLIETPTGPRELRWKSLVLATGARELFLPFPGWNLPGVVGAGGMQALVKQGLDVAGRRIVVAGSGPLLLAVADLLRAKGADVPIVLEQATATRVNQFGVSLVRTPGKLLEAIALRWRLRRTPYATGSYPVRADSTGNTLRVTYRRRGRAATIDCDCLACGFGLIPNVELPLLLGCGLTPGGFVRVDEACRTTVPDVYAVGELTGIGGVDKALFEGHLAATAAAGANVRFLGRARESMMSFVRDLDRAFALRPEVLNLAGDDTVVCRCEDVPLDAVRRAVSGRDAKLQTRCGMGPCQGRVCGPILQRLCGTEPPAVRPPVFATPVGTLSRASRP